MRTRKVPLVAMTMATSAPATEDAVPLSWLDDWLISMSTVWTSAEKRFRIRPRGVVSKKATGARRTDATRFSCSALEAPRRCVAMESDRRTRPSTPPMHRSAYLPR